MINIFRPIKRLLCLITIAVSIFLFTTLSANAAQTTSLATPQLNAPVNTAAGVKVSWSAVKGAAKYRVFLKTAASWIKLGDTAATSFTHTSALSGNNYTYTVRCLSANGKSYSSAFDPKGKSVTYIAAPRISGLSNQTNGVKITWGAVMGAQKYRVFLKNGTAWKKLADTAATNLSHTAVTSGKSYTYTVRCLSADGKSFTSACYAGKAITFVQTPKITAITDTPSGAKLTWNACTGAAQYRVYIKSGSSWTTLASTKSTSYTHAANHETACTYTVRCQNAAGSNVSSYYANGWTHTYRIPAVMNAPVISGFESLDGGVEIRWNQVNGAKKYRVLIKRNNVWSKLGDTTKTCFINTNATSGVSDTYTVCCISADGRNYLSAYDTNGKSFTYVKAPDLQEISNTANGALLRWDECAGAEGYRIFVHDGEAWSILTDTSENSYLHTDAPEDTDVAYTVCCLDANGNPISAYHEQGVINRYSPDETKLICTKAMFAEEVYNLLDKTAEAFSDPNALLNRRGASEILVKALIYKKRSAVKLSDTDDPNLLTTAYYGYFLPDDSDRIFPAQQISDSEHALLLKEVERYVQLKDKRLLAFGDSIVYGKGNSGSSFGRMTAEKYGMKYTCYAVSGATFGICNNNKHISDEIRSAYIAGAQADVILLDGGTNDTHLVHLAKTQDTFNPEKPAESTFASGFEYSMMLIRHYWADVPVIYVRAHNMGIDPDTLEQQMGEYGLQIAENWGAYTVDLYSDTALNTEDAALRDRYTMFKDKINNYDGIHPTALGYVTYYMPLFSEKLFEILITE